MAKTIGSTRVMHTRLTNALVAGGLVGALIAPGAASGAPERSDHGHMLVLGVEVAPGSFPPVPVSVRGCVDLAAGARIPAVANHDQRHEGFDGGEFTARTGNIVIPTYPFQAPDGHVVPWRDCDDFLAFFGLDE